MTGLAKPSITGSERNQSPQPHCLLIASLIWASSLSLTFLNSAVEISFSYSYASATAYTIVQKHGRKALLKLLTAYNSNKNKGSGRKLADRVVRRTLGKSLKTLESEVDSYASSRSRF